MRKLFKEVFDTGRDSPCHKTLYQTSPLSEWGSLQKKRSLWMSWVNLDQLLQSRCPTNNPPEIQVKKNKFWWNILICGIRFKNKRLKDLKTYCFQLRVCSLDGNKLHVLRKALVKPYIIPPLHSYQVSEPL